MCYKSITLLSSEFVGKRKRSVAHAGTEVISSFLAEMVLHCSQRLSRMCRYFIFLEHWSHAVRGCGENTDLGMNCRGS